MIMRRKEYSKDKVKQLSVQRNSLTSLDVEKQQFYAKKVGKLRAAGHFTIGGFKKLTKTRTTIGFKGDTSAVYKTEIFGPVLAIQTFRTVEEVIEKANNTPFGLSAGVWTDKGSKIFTMTSKLKAGVIWANTYNKFDPASPFGGYKESGFGREGGLHGLMPYLTFN